MTNYFLMCLQNLKFCLKLYHLTWMVDDARADAAKIVGQLHNVDRLELLFFHPNHWKFAEIVRLEILVYNRIKIK